MALLSNEPTSTSGVSRRTFLAGTVATGLVIAVALPVGIARQARAQQVGAATSPNAFVRVAPDNTVTVLIKHLDKGQGIATGLASLVAEELDADPTTIRTEFAPANAALYGNVYFGGFQGTGQSTSIRDSFDKMRRAGAAARAMLVSAAALRWGVPAQEISVHLGVVSHTGSGQSADFGDLALAAAALPIPEDVLLKAPGGWTIIGKAFPRVDSAAKSDGTAIFGLDARTPDTIVAVMKRPDRFGAVVGSFDAARAKEVPGVIDVISVGLGVAVLARDTWAAIKARDLITVTWDDRTAEIRGSDEMMADLRALSEAPGLIAVQDGDVEAAFRDAAEILEADYELPYLAHAPMEPLNVIVDWQGDRCRITGGCQAQSSDQMTAAAILGLAPENVEIVTTWAGGSFGRRATPGSDLVAEAVLIAKATNGAGPIQLMWTRGDDIKGGFYRPMFYHRLRAALAPDRMVTGWRHTLAGQSINIGTPIEGFLVKDGVDAMSVEGAADMPYAFANRLTEVHNAPTVVPALWWRSVGHSHTAFAIECFVDELAQAAGTDPLIYRRSLLADHPRHLAVLNLAAEKAGWGTPMPKGHGRGIAVHESFGTWVANVIEVDLSQGDLRVMRVVCAVDCGTVVNPDNVVAQFEGGVGFGLGAALQNKIVLEEGRVQQANFDDYLPLRMSQMPKVEVHLIDSVEPPGGVGEPPVPCVAPALANAIVAAGGKRVRKLPFLDEVFL
ncbi:molybdopterin cofactor-binding domain-containing protein [Rhodophyticola sp.]|jgi:isoquinoline 1-oxidoreductase beta subunit|uniref:xanthine dehydrogenase family protein molybdopterin-binding subunit n=1 Tax=Rhodophyticola sp. TaxID=2680032 RepID=UPI003D26F4B8